MSEQIQQPITDKIKQQIPVVLGGQLVYPNNNKEVFGPHYWFSLHNPAANYPDYPSEKDKEDFRGLFNILVRDIPCTESCRIHTRDYVRLHPLEPNLESREKLFDYMCHFHNYVNRLNGKQVYECSTMLSNRMSAKKQDDREVVQDEGQQDRVQQESNSAANQGEEHSQTEKTSQNNKKEKRSSNPSTIHRETIGSNFQPIKRRGASDVEKDVGQYSRHSDEAVSTDARAGNKNDIKGLARTSTNDNGQSGSGVATPAADTESLLESLFENHKNLSSEIVKTICKKEGVPEPKIKYAPCPDPQHANTSCVFNNQDGSLTLYNNPYNYGLRSIIHEVDHYVKRMKGYSNMNEREAEDYARSTISKYYKPDNEPTIVMTPSNKVVTDATGEKEYSVTEYTPLKVVDPETRFRTWADEIGSSSENDVFMRFPRLKQHMQELEKQKKAEEDKKLATEGLLSHMDHIFEMPGEWLGVTGAQLNTIATPIILQNIIGTVVESNTTPLGAIAINLITGLSLTAALALSKNSISHRDKLLLTGLASGFLFSSIKYANPKIMEELKSLIIQVNAKMNVSDYDGMWNLFIETPGMHRFNENINNVQNATGTGVRTDPRVAMARAHARQGTVQIPERNTIQNMTESGEFQIVDNTQGTMGPESMGVDNVIASRRNPASRLRIAGGDESHSIFD